jgi:(E)-4-hydroxy-3-methylbut-2-enyl-diphosphate synthase
VPAHRLKDKSIVDHLVALVEERARAVAAAERAHAEAASDAVAAAS